MSHPGERAVDDALFWDIAEPLLGAGATRSTMMGFPCLRIDGAFFASVDHRSGDLIVKLPASRVEELIESGDGAAFAPNGRRFKEWTVIAERDEVLWTNLAAEALRYAKGTKS